jgi:Ca-activated chloride channel family protein
VRLDRDVVVRWPVGAPRVGLSLQTARPAASSKHGAVAYGLLTIVPPSPEARGEAVTRDLIVLVDTSGSMGGRPLEQAAQVVSALVEGLTPRDRIELISFDSQPRRWRRGPVEATPEVRRDAVKWLKGLRAGGSTEMRTGIVEALRPLRAGAQRQIILVTDGYVGFEREIVETLHAHLPRGSRLHTIGVGSAVNRSLTGPAARAGRGVEVVVGLDEDPTEGARRLVARTFAPLVTDVVIDGDAVLAYAPAAMPDLFAGAPVLASLKLRPEGGSLRVRGSTAAGEWSQAIVVPPTAAASGSPAVVALYGREAVEDLETCWAMGNDAPRIDAEIERIGLAFQIATRLTSWVAVAHTPAVDPRTPRRHEDIAHELPHGMSIEGLGLRSTGSYAPPQPAPIGGFAPWGGALTQSGYMAPAAMARASAPLQPQVARRAADEGASMSSMFAPMAPAQAKRAGRPWAWALLLLVLVLLVGFVAYLLASRPTTRAGVDGLRRDDGLFAALDGLAASRPSLVDAFVAARGACQRAPRGRASLG